jgi:hypothetical protein
MAWVGAGMEKWVLVPIAGWEWDSVKMDATFIAEDCRGGELGLGSSGGSRLLAGEPSMAHGNGGL